MRHSLATLLFMFPLIVSAEDDQTVSAKMVQHDPFKKPPLFQVSNDPIIVDKPVIEELTNYKLTAILQAGNDSMVSLQGKTVQLGEQFEGYTLIEINDRSAIFSKDKKTVTLKIDKAEATTKP